MASGSVASSPQGGSDAVGVPAGYGTARLLLLFSAVGIIYGSLYPFRFEFAPMALSDAAEVLLTDWRGEFRPVNVLTNVLLFVPYGLFGAVALAAWHWLPRWLLLYLSAAVIAFGLQVAQLWLPGRVPTFADGAINMVGTVAGATIARLPGVHALMTHTGRHARQALALPFLLMLCWVAYRWFPFVPSVDVFSIKDGLRPLLLEPELRPLDAFHNAVAWIVFACLWEQCRLSWWWLWLVIPGVVVAQVGITANPLVLHNVMGAAAALLVWTGLRYGFRRPIEPVILLLLAMLVVQGLRPFELAQGAFLWLPFQGFLHGNMTVNLLSLIEKLFLYGSLVWLTLEASQSRVTALLLPAVMVAGIEIAQIWIASRTAEITDPLLCVAFWGVAMVAWRPYAQRRQAAVTSP
ncbi:VanZ family protein [Aquisalimonas sp.]|uniref:VanZ family protein n=1 Tax=unclassified Aquisalimonas TaxID=2644645 RepID=UPI0025BB412B|nr:VanZ family protein [Aquisalimonas sp.]